MTTALTTLAIIAAGLIVAGLVYSVVWTLLTFSLRRLMCGPVPGLWSAALVDNLAAMRVVSWELLPRKAPRAASEQPLPHDYQGPVLVFVHGTATSGVCWRRYIDAARAAGITAPIYAIDHGNLLRHAKVHGARVARALRAIVADNDDARLVLVAHSLGGVAVRYALDGDDELRGKIDGVVSIAAPHQGTGFARALPMGPVASLLWQTKALLEELPQLDALVPKVQSFGSAVDVIVYPEETCRAGGPHEVVADIGHAGLLTNSGFAARIAGIVRDLMRG